MPHRKHLGSYPAMKIGRLAISRNHQGEGIGTKLVSAIKQMTVNSQTAISACRFLTVDAYKEALPFMSEMVLSDWLMKMRKGNIPFLCITI